MLFRPGVGGRLFPCKVMKKMRIFALMRKVLNMGTVVKNPLAKMVLLMFAMIFAFSSCGDDAWFNEDRLVGEWHTQDDPGNSYTVVKFYGDGTGMITQYDYGSVSDYSSFLWEASRHSIHFRYNDRPSEYWDIEFEGRNAFRLYFDDGDYTYFVRDY